MNDRSRCMHGLIDVHTSVFPSSVHWEGLEALSAKGLSDEHIYHLVSKYPFPIKVTGFFIKVADSKSCLEKIQVESEHFVLAARKCIKNRRVGQKVTVANQKEFPMAKAAIIWETK